MERWNVQISGLVQGVGFRPFLYNLALSKKLTGWVRNNFGGVEIEIQGELGELESFLTDLRAKAPAASVIERLEIQKVSQLSSERQFVILNSEFGHVSGSPLPDQGICAACAAEFFLPGNRRFQYAFNSCTICGPRFTIIGGLPFDRPRTAMSGFELCPQCLHEYTSPADRRFHAQTIACPSCGPALRFIDPKGSGLQVDPAMQAREILKGGGIIGVKGIGGYHLTCLASDEHAVGRLRKLKGRDNRAFAVMFRDLDTVKVFCELSPDEAKIINSAARPILLLTQKQFPGLASAVNPGLREIGAFLPYSGIQLALFDKQIDSLVMTSGNQSGEPLVMEDEKAIADLGPMVDGFLIHNRSILWRCDDSVMRWQQGKLIGIRRSRGYAPAPVKLGRELVPLLACGAQQKNVFALTKGEYIYLSPHQGDLDHLATFLSYQETIDRFTRLLQCKPVWAVHDLHPDYQSTIYAKNSSLKTIGIQHHLAHLASVIAACKIERPIIGVVLDGTGYGTDGKIWGGEFFSGEETNWVRQGAFTYYPLPGGEMAVREPWRMAAAYLQGASPVFLDQWLQEKGLTEIWQPLATAIRLGINAPYTSSAGRFFDGIAAMIGGPLEVSYEGEAAVWLENQAVSSAKGNYSFRVQATDDGLRIDPGTIAQQVYQDLAGCNIGTISMKFHRTLAMMIGEMVKLIYERTRSNQVVLSGGVFQNRLLLDLCVILLRSEGFEVFVPEIVPINDGGIALGQAWLANLMIERGISDVLSNSR